MRQAYLSLGSFTLYFYGFFISLGGILGYFIARKRIKRFKLTEKILDKIFFLIIVAAVIGARTYHVLSWFSYYQLFPKETLYVWQGGLGVYGAIIAGIIIVYIFVRVENIEFLLITDLLAPSILISQAIGRIGNFFNVEAFGPPTNLPWKFYVPPGRRPINFLDQSYFHPTFFYESILCFLALLIVLYFEHQFRVRKGFSFGIYLLAYGLIRFFTEFLRFDTWVISGIKVAQIISVCFIFFGVILIKHGTGALKLVKLKK